MRGDKTALAQRVLLADPDWQAPLLWRSELRNVLTLYMRHREMELADAHRVMDLAERLLAGSEHEVSSTLVLDLASASSASAHDCEFVALARSLSCPLISAGSRA